MRGLLSVFGRQLAARQPHPSYASSWGPRNLLGNRTQDLLRKILEDAAANRSAAPGSNAQKVGDFYASAMDTVAIDRAGLAPLKPELDRVAAVRNAAGLHAEIVHLQELGPVCFSGPGWMWTRKTPPSTPYR